MKFYLVGINIILFIIIFSFSKEVLNAYYDRDVDFSNLECNETFNFKPVSQTYKGKSYYDSIIKDTLFPPEKKDLIKEQKVNKQDMEEVRRKALQNLRLELKGIILSTPSKAVIDDRKTGQEGLYKVKDEISGAMLKAIEPNRIVLEYNGYEFELKLFEDVVSLIPIDESQEIVEEKSIDEIIEEIPYTPQNIGGRYTVTRAEIFRQVLNFSRILKTVSIQPIKIDGKIQFYQINDIQENNFLYSMGMRSGDVLHSVNGSRIDSFESAIATGRKFKDSSQIFVKVLRNNNEVTLMYDVE